MDNIGGSIPRAIKLTPIFDIFDDFLNVVWYQVYMIDYLEGLSRNVLPICMTLRHSVASCTRLDKCQSQLPFPLSVHLLFFFRLVDFVKS